MLLTYGSKLLVGLYALSTPTYHNGSTSTSWTLIVSMRLITVQLYMLGLMDINTAIGRLAQHQPNNQICLLNQSLMDECLHYIGCEFLNNEARQKGGQP